MCVNFSVMDLLIYMQTSKSGVWSRLGPKGDHCISFVHQTSHKEQANVLISLQKVLLIDAKEDCLDYSVFV